MATMMWFMYLIFFIAIIIITGVVLYLKSRKTLFEINYAGGKIAFDISLYSKSEIDDFQKQLRHAKDLAIRKNSSLDGNTNCMNSSNADEIAKYYDLYKQGIFSKEEFEHIKNKAIE